MKTSQIFTLCFCVFNEALQGAIIWPFLPFAAQRWGSSPELVGWYTGLLASAFFVAQFIFGAPWGHASDRWGRRPTILLGLLGTACSMALFGFARDFPTALLARFLTGGLNGNIAISKTYMGEVVEPENIAKGFSYLSFCWGFGSIIAPLLGGLLAEPADAYPAIFGGNEFLIAFPYVLPSLVSACFAIVAFIVGAAFLPETSVWLARRDAARLASRAAGRNGRAASAAAAAAAGGSGGGVAMGDDDDVDGRHADSAGSSFEEGERNALIAAPTAPKSVHTVAAIRGRLRLESDEDVVVELSGAVIGAAQSASKSGTSSLMLPIPNAGSSVDDGGERTAGVNGDAAAPSKQKGMPRRVSAASAMEEGDSLLGAGNARGVDKGDCVVEEKKAERHTDAAGIAAAPAISVAPRSQLPLSKLRGGAKAQKQSKHVTFADDGGLGSPSKDASYKRTVAAAAAAVEKKESSSGASAEAAAAASGTPAGAITTTTGAAAASSHPLQATDDTSPAPPLGDSGSICGVLRNPVIMAAVFVYAALSIAAIIFEELNPVLMKLDGDLGGFGFTVSQVGLSQIVCGFTIIINQLWVLPLLMRRYSDRIGGPIGFCRYSLLLQVTLVLTPAIGWLRPYPGAFWTALVLYQIWKTALSNVAFTTIIVIINNSSRDMSLGLTNGVAQATCSLFRSVGPSIGGSVFSLAVSLVNKSSPTSFLLLHIPYALLALLFIVSFFITYRLPQWVNKAPVRLQPHSPSTAAAANAAAATVASSTHEVSIDVDQHDIDISSNGQLGDSDSEEIQEPRPFSFSSSERVTV